MLYFEKLANFYSKTPCASLTKANINKFILTLQIPIPWIIYRQNVLTQAAISNQEHQECGLDASRLSNSFYKRMGAVHTNDEYHVNI